MEASDHFESLKEMVSCSVCGQILSDLYPLPCFHNLCLEDKNKLPVEQGEDGEGIRCPVCNSFAKASEKGNEALMRQLMAVYAKVSEKKCECTQCKSMNARWRCVDCKVDLCGTCEQGHQNISVCKGHRTIRHEECDPKTLATTVVFVFCERHPDKEIEFYCADCDAVLCYKCHVLNHKLHNCESLEEATERIRPLVEADVNTLKERSCAYGDEIAKLKQEGSDVSKSSDVMKEAILRERDEMIAKIEAETKAKLNALETNTAERLKQIQGHQENLEYSCANIRSLTNWSKSVLDNTTGATMLIELQDKLIPSLKKMCDSTAVIPKQEQEVELTTSGMAQAPVLDTVSLQSASATSQSVSTGPVCSESTSTTSQSVSTGSVCSESAAIEEQEQEWEAVCLQSGPSHAQTESQDGVLDLMIYSYGNEDPGKAPDMAWIILNDETFRFKNFAPNAPKRGIFAMEVDTQIRTFKNIATFDTHRSEERVVAFKQFVKGVGLGNLVVIATADEYTKAFKNKKKAKELLVLIGCPEVTGSGHNYRSSLAAIALKKMDGSYVQIAKQYKKKGKGPASLKIQLSVDKLAEQSR